MKYKILFSIILATTIFLQNKPMQAPTGISDNFYLNIEGQEYILQKDHPLLETSYFINAKNFTGLNNGNINNPYQLENVYYNTFDAIVKLINNESSLDNFDFEEYLAFVEFVDFFGIIQDLKNKDRFTEKNQKLLEIFIFDLAKRIQTNTSMIRHLEPAINKIIIYYKENAHLNFEDRPEQFLYYKSKIEPKNWSTKIQANFKSILMYNLDGFTKNPYWIEDEIKIKNTIINLEKELLHEKIIDRETYLYVIIAPRDRDKLFTNNYLGLIQILDKNSVKVLGVININTKEIIYLEDM